MFDDCYGYLDFAAENGKEIPISGSDGIVHMTVQEAFSKDCSKIYEERLQAWKKEHEKP